MKCPNETVVMEALKELKEDIKQLSDKVVLHHDEALVFKESTKNLYTTVSQNSGAVFALRKSVQDLTTDVKLITQGIETLSKEHEEYKKDIQEKANKWVESVLIWVGSFAGVSILGAIAWVLTESIKRFQ